MSKPAIEVITSVERRRRWSTAEKERLVAASLEGAPPCPRLPARLASIQGSSNGWRRQLLRRSQPILLRAATVTSGRPQRLEFDA